MIEIGVFGEKPPKFIYDLGGLNEQEVKLEHWVEIDFDYDSRYIIHDSQLEADRDFLPRGEFLDITGKLYLFKYPDKKAKLEELYQFRKKKVILYPHWDGDPYKDSAGNAIEFYIDYIIPRNLGTLDFRDVVYIRFLSLKEVDHAQMLYPQLVDDNNDVLLDDNDNPII